MRLLGLSRQWAGKEKHMKFGIKSLREKLTDSKGFTLVEMAIVLIIIGIIIGAVVKGKDLVRGAEQKKVYTKFVSAWNLAYLNFYDRTGKILGDNTDGTLGQTDGRADTVAGTELLTSTQAGIFGIIQVGLEAPVTNAANAFTYRYIDSQGTGHDMTVTFAYEGTGNYNYMLITPIPVEMAMALDTMIDGEADGLNDDFIGYNLANTAAADWSAAALPTTQVSARWRMQF